MANPNLDAKEKERIISRVIVALGSVQNGVKATKIADTLRHKSASALLGAARKAVRKEDSRKRPASPSLREGRASPVDDGHQDDDEDADGAMMEE